MIGEQHKDFLLRYAEEVWNGGNLDAAGDYVAPDYARHQPGLPPGLRGPDLVKHLVALYQAAFPDFHIAIEDLIAEGDKVVARMRVSGTHRGELLGIPPTGKPVAITAIEIFRLAGGRVVEQWAEADTLGLLQQLGAIPAPA
jgi:steroid delta-isomerase-like uncharacterized protein